jgi:predicted metalloprotease
VRWAGGRRSDNVEDRRGMGGGRIAIGGGVGGLIVLVLALLFGADPRALLRQMQTDTAQEAPSQPGAPAPGVPDQSREFISVVLAETEDVWREQFQKMGRQYADPKLVLFSDEVESACGVAGAAVGPFYCPEDDQIYLDLSFFEQLDQLGGPGDFAQAYVVAHEVGHHVHANAGGPGLGADR